MIDGELFGYLAPTVWNGLLLNIRLYPTTDTFKRHVKSNLFKQLINTVNDAVHTKTKQFRAIRYDTIVCV